MHSQFKKTYELSEANSRNSQGDQERLYKRHIRGAFLEVWDFSVQLVLLENQNKGFLPRGSYLCEHSSPSLASVVTSGHWIHDSASATKFEAPVQ